MRYHRLVFRVLPWRSLLCLLLAAGARSGAEAQPAARSVTTDSPIIGEWRGEVIAGGAVADVTLNLFPNGTYARRVIALTEFGWTLDGEMLLLAPVTGLVNNEVTFGKASAIRVKLEGDSLIARLGKESLVLKRLTSLVAHMPLLGRWEGLTDMNEPITQDFTADGRLIISVTMSREAGRYSINDESITWAEQIPIPSRRRSKYRIQDGKLIIYISPKLPPTELKRVELGPTPP